MESVTKPTLFGRRSELGVIAQFLDEVPQRSSALVLVGEAGIGKTTLWEAGVESASIRGWLVLKARPGASETTMTFAALGDLLDPVVDEVLDEIPSMQRSALRTALLRAEPGDEQVFDQRAVALGTLGCLRALARGRPVLLAIDDVQWLDPSSATVLRFAVRRLQDERIGVLASTRPGREEEDPLGSGGAMREGASQRVLVRSMSPDDIGRLIRNRVDADLPRPVRERVHDAANGNPFFALEIARELTRSGSSDVGETLPLPADVRDLLIARISALPEPTRQILLTAAAAGRPTVALLAAASGPGPGTEGTLAAAIESGLVSPDGDRIRFTHPLMASAVYTSASSTQRRQTHRRLAGLVEDRDERARHLALATQDTDDVVAEVLDDAAAAAAARGAPQSAAELAELARKLTPVEDVEGSVRRAEVAAAHLFDAGDDAGARRLLEDALAMARTDGEQARILSRLASVSWMDMRRVSDLCQRALALAADDLEISATAHDHLSWVGIYRGDLTEARDHAQAAMQLAVPGVDAALRADVFATAGMVEFIAGRSPETLMTEAANLHEIATSGHGTQATVFTSAPTCRGLQLIWAGELSTARDVLEGELRAYEARGRYIVRDEVLGYLAELECRAGRWGLAERYAREAFDIDLESGRSSSKGHQLFPKAIVAALQGRVQDARSDAELGLELCIEDGDLLDANCHRWVLGFLDLSLSDHVAAIRRLEPVIEYLDVFGAVEPGIIPCTPDAVEVLISLGRRDEAEALAERLRDQGTSLNRPWARATALRCRGLLLADRGDPDGALVSLEKALEEHTLVPQPFDLARTLLVKGEVERRAKQKKAARSSLEQALATFEELGASLWSDRARKGLERIGGRPPSPLQLTGTERQVAELVAAGRTNAEVAGELFMSVDTVRSNLRRIYGKLDVRHRGELAGKLPAIDIEPQPGQ
jgi:DNA-binding CsgD family transcriptional regulator